MFVVQQEHTVSIRIKLRIGNWLVFAHSNESITPCTTIYWLVNWNFQIGGHLNKLAASGERCWCVWMHMLVCLP